MTSGSCSIATCRSRRWRSSWLAAVSRSRSHARRDRGHRDGSGPRTTDCVVDGFYAKRSVAVAGSSPAAAQRRAEGAGLDPGAADRSTIQRAVKCDPTQSQTESTAAHRLGTARGYTPNPHQIDGRDRGQQDLLRSRLDQIVDPAHPLAKLGRTIDWGFLEERLGAVYTDRPGRPPLPTRLMAGLAILKHMHNLSDEVLCERWLENPYYQLLCGEEFFRHTLPFDRSPLTRWRQRMGEAKTCGPAEGEPARGEPHRCCQAGRLHPRHRRYHGAAEGDRLPDRCPPAASCARAPGAAGAQAWRGAATILCACRQGRA